MLAVTKDIGRTEALIYNILGKVEDDFSARTNIRLCISAWSITLTSIKLFLVKMKPYIYQLFIKIAIGGKSPAGKI